MMESDAKADRAVRITFDLSQIFPSDDTLSIPLLRLMAAINDARYIMKQSLALLTHNETANELEAPIINGELLYLFRLLCGHLYEAGVAFRNLEQRHTDLLDAVVADDPNRSVDLALVRNAFSSGRDSAFHYSFLHPVRNTITFHYKSEALTMELKKRNEARDLKGTTIVADRSGLGRHTICDHLATGILREVIGTNHENFAETLQEKMNEVLTLTGALGPLVDQILVYLFAQSATAIIEDKWGEVRTTL
jgi:hypothetical protein